MENTKIEKKDVVIGILDIIDGAAFGALVGKAVKGLAGHVQLRHGRG